MTSPPPHQARDGRDDVGADPTSDKANAHPAQPGGRTIPCARCGFNLVGLTIGEPCPDCGLPTGRSPGSSWSTATADRPGSNGKAIASLVLGIVAIVSCTMWGIPAVICGPLAIIFGKQAKLAVMRGEAPPSTLSTANAGRVCGIVGTCLGGVALLFMILYFAFIVGIFGFAVFGASGGNQPLPMPPP